MPLRSATASFTQTNPDGSLAPTPLGLDLRLDDGSLDNLPETLEAALYDHNSDYIVHTFMGACIVTESSGRGISPVRTYTKTGDGAYESVYGETRLRLTFGDAGKTAILDAEYLEGDTPVQRTTTFVNTADPGIH
jgi:hypothetical protein